MDQRFPTLRIRLRTGNFSFRERNSFHVVKRREITGLAGKMLKGGQWPYDADQIPDPRTGLTIPSALVTMERLDDGTSLYDIKFATPNIAQVVADVQGEREVDKELGDLERFLPQP